MNFLKNIAVYAVNQRKYVPAQQSLKKLKQKITTSTTCLNRIAENCQTSDSLKVGLIFCCSSVEGITMITFTTGTLSDTNDLKKKGFTVIDVTTRSAKPNARSLVPTWPMVMGYRNRRITEEEYTSQYMDILKKSQQENRSRWEKTIENHNKVAFTCFCPSGVKFCHRYILAAEFFRFARDETKKLAFWTIETPSQPENPPPRPTRSTPKTFLWKDTLKKDEVFAYGSNNFGHHGAGSAGLAMKDSAKNDWRTNKKFQRAMKAPVGHPDRIGHWAVYGISRGHQVGHNGESYAIATVTNPGAQRSISLAKIGLQLEELFLWAGANPKKTIYCTINGGGYNGYSKEEIASTYPLTTPNNILIPKDIYDILFSPAKKETGDGVDHINIYSKGKTTLGKWMTNFAKSKVEIDGEQFLSIEGYWYWLGLDAPSKEANKLQEVYGYKAKQLGKELKGLYGSTDIPEFEEKICSAIRKKVASDKQYKRMLKESTLPFKHYYEYGGKKVDAGYKWQVELWEDIRRELQEELPPAKEKCTKIIIAGSREFSDYEYLKKCLDKIAHPLDTVISGTARGADQLGERYASDKKLKVIKMPADWEKHGKSAGYKRNEEMAKQGDLLCAFWDGTSRGTKHMIDLAKKHGLKVHVFSF